MEESDKGTLPALLCFDSAVDVSWNSYWDVLSNDYCVLELRQVPLHSGVEYTHM